MSTITIHEPRDPQPPKWLALAGLFGIIDHDRSETTLSRFQAYYPEVGPEKRGIARLVMQSHMGGDHDLAGRRAVSVVKWLSRTYEFTAEELRQMAVEVLRGTKLDPYFQDPAHWGEAACIAAHVTEWFLDQNVGEDQLSSGPYFGNLGRQDYFEKLSEGQERPEHWYTIMTILIENGVHPDLDLDFDPHSLHSDLQQPLSDAGIKY